MDPLMHIGIPALILAAFGYKFSETLKFSFLAILPDIFYYTSFHRNLSHSYFFLIPFCFLIYFISKNKRVTFICAVFLLSHPILDLGGYTAIFYPIPQYLRIYAELSMNQTTFSPVSNFMIEIAEPGDIEWIYTSYALQTSTSLIFILIFSVFLFENRQKIIKRVKERIR